MIETSVMMKKMKEYYDRFGDVFPSFEIGSTRTEDEMFVVINDCLRKGKDAHELGYVTDDHNIFY